MSPAARLGGEREVLLDLDLGLVGDVERSFPHAGNEGGGRAFDLDPAIEEEADDVADRSEVDTRPHADAHSVAQMASLVPCRPG
jgi:hypothetical protein